MSDYGDYKSYREYLNAKMRGRDCQLITLSSPIPGQSPGEFGMLEMGPKGKFLHAFEDGILFRVDDSEDVIEWDKVKRIRFISGIHTVAPAGLVGR